MKSLQRTLAVRFCGTMLVALVVIALWAYVGVQRTLHRQLDRSLQSAAELQLDALAAGGGLVIHSDEPDAVRFVEQVNRLVALRDSSGGIVAVNTELARPLPLDTASFTRARHGSVALATGPWLHGDVRTIYVRAPPGSPPGAVVLQVAASLDPLDRASRAVLYRMLTTALLGSLVTLVGAGWLAASSVKPVREIAAQAAGITWNGTGQRITAHADVSEFEGLIGVLNEMLSRLERASGWHQSIIRDLGHDLRTPITAMRAGVEVALWTERSPDEYRRVLASTMEEIERLALISDALIMMGRLASGRLTSHSVALDARAVARDAVRRVQQRVGGHRISLVAGGPVPVHGDARLLGMVLDQLLDNGMRHTAPGTPVTVSVGLEDSGAQFLVEDRGAGVPDEMLPHLFEPFYRTDPARHRNGGPGLGLTLAAAITALHHGTIQAERSDAGGLRIRVRLPSRGGTAPGLSASPGAAASALR